MPYPSTGTPPNSAVTDAQRKIIDGMHRQGIQYHDISPQDIALQRVEAKLDRLLTLIEQPTGAIITGPEVNRIIEGLRARNGKD